MDQSIQLAYKNLKYATYKAIYLTTALPPIQSAIPSLHQLYLSSAHLLHSDQQTLQNLESLTPHSLAQLQQLQLQKIELQNSIRHCFAIDNPSLKNQSQLQAQLEKLMSEVNHVEEVNEFLERQLSSQQEHRDQQVREELRKVEGKMERLKNEKSRIGRNQKQLQGNVQGWHKKLLKLRERKA